MSGSKRRLRGQPLAALLLLLGFWVGGRAVLWEPLLAGPVGARGPAASDAGPVRLADGPERKHGLLQPDGQEWPRRAQAVPSLAPASVPVFAPAALPITPPPPALSRPGAVLPVVPVPPPRKAAPGVLAPRIAAAHQMAWLAAVAQLPLPPEAALALAPSPGRQAAGRADQAALPRWSADGWLLLRQGGSGISPGGALLPSLGASQVGAVVRYRLAPGSAHRPALYLRASSALRQPRGEELAAGLALRSLAGVPLAAMAEVRLTQTPGGAHLRPAAALVTELPPAALPGGLRAETYVQAGYVGGAGATPFIDGQARIEAPLANAGKFRLRAGAGAWGGAQQGAARLDIGPTATLAVPLGSGGGRLTADWRFRVAGNAAPATGLALTLSAGF